MAKTEAEWSISHCKLLYYHPERRRTVGECRAERQPLVEAILSATGPTLPPIAEATIFGRVRLFRSA